MARKSSEKHASNVPNWSWVVAALGLALVVGAVGFFLGEALKSDGAPPELVIETGAVVVNGGGYVLPIIVRNRGEQVASGLVVEGVLKEGTVTIETSSVTFDYVPVGSTRHGGLIFKEDPRDLDVEVQARGYALP